MNADRQYFLIVLALVNGASILGVTGFSVAEYMARLELPPEQQSEEAIKRLHDGAVCLGCDFGKMGSLMLGSIFFGVNSSNLGDLRIGRKAVGTIAWRS